MDRRAARLSEEGAQKLAVCFHINKSPEQEAESQQIVGNPRRTVGSPGAAYPSFAIWGSFWPPAPRGTSSPPPRAPTPPSRPPPPPPRSPPGPSSAADAPRSASATALSRSGSFRLVAATARSAHGPAVRRAPRRPRRTRSARRTPGPGHWRRRELAPRRNRSAVAAPRTGPRAGRPRADRGVFGLPELQRCASGSAMM